MTTTTKTRCKVSAKSWLKAERKAAAKGYKTPNRRLDSYSALYWAERHRGLMEKFKQMMFVSTYRGEFDVYFNAYIYNRRQYKLELQLSRAVNNPFPLP